MHPAGPSSGPDTLLVAGLGNPGSRYARTRHNAGAWFVEALCDKLSLTLGTQSRFKALVAQGTLHHVPCHFLITQDFMNHSGQTIAPIAHYYRIPPAQILIVHDELDLPPGTFRFKSGGGHAGHNGLRDLIQHLGSPDFQRLRLGIGHPGKAAERQLDVSEYVLAVPPATEAQSIHEAIRTAMDQLPQWLSTRGASHGF